MPARFGNFFVDDHLNSFCCVTLICTHKKGRSHLSQNQCKKKKSFWPAKFIIPEQQKMLARHNVEDIQTELVKKLLLQNILPAIIFFWIHLIILSYVVCFSQVMKKSSLLLTLLSRNTYLRSCKTSTTSIAEEYNSSSSTKRYTHSGT